MPRLVAILLVGRSGGGAGLAHRARHLLRDSRDTVRVHRRRDGAQHAGPVDQRRDDRRRRPVGDTGSGSGTGAAGARRRVRGGRQRVLERMAERVGQNAADGAQDRLRRARVPLLGATSGEHKRVRSLLSF